MSEAFDVVKIAKLSYLELTDNEKESFLTQFSQILKYVDKLNEIKMTSEQAKEMGAFHVSLAFYEKFKLDTAQSLRTEDQVKAVNELNLTNDEALTNAPKKSGLPGELLFEVPSIIER